MPFCRQAWHMHELHYIYSQTRQFPCTSDCSKMMVWHSRHGSRNLCISRARLHTASSSVPGDRHRSMRWAENMSVCLCVCVCVEWGSKYRTSYFYCSCEWPCVWTTWHQKSSVTSRGIFLLAFVRSALNEAMKGR